MAEPTSMSHAALWGGGAITSGLALAVGAVEANPEMALALTPSTGASLIGLICAGVGLALRNYMPSEKEVKQEFLLLKAQHAAIIENMANSAKSAEEVRKKLETHQLKLAEWMGDVNRNLSNINGKIDSLERRKAS